MENAVGYVAANLVAGEQVIYEGKLSLWKFLPRITIGVILVPVFLLGLLVLLDVLITYKTTELAITNRRVIAKFGFIRRHAIEIDVRRVESIQVNQGILGRIFDFGSIMLSGAGNPLAAIPGVSAPMTFRKQFLEHQALLA
jgi:uncharacterized membrane protein YdbT with pleckstrin-like domain